MMIKEKIIIGDKAKTILSSSTFLNNIKLKLSRKTQFFVSLSSVENFSFDETASEEKRLKIISQTH